MQLSLIYLCSRTFLMILVSNLLQWENVASQSTCDKKNGRCNVSLKDLILRAAMVTQYLNTHSAQLFTEFDKQYGQGRGFHEKTLSSCHTAPLPTPKNHEEGQQLHPEVLLKLTVSMLGSWTQPLQQLVTEIGHMQGSSHDLLSMTRNIEKKSKGLLKGLEKILSRVPNVSKAKVEYSAWSGLASLQDTNEDSRLFAFYNILHCLREDANKIDTYLNFLRCQLVHPQYC